MNRNKMVTLVIVIAIALSVVMIPIAFLGLDEGTILMLGSVTMTLTLIIVFVLVFHTFSTRKVVVDFSIDGFTVKGPMLEITVPFNEITAMELRGEKEIKFGVRTWGYGGIRYAGGTFSNKEFGTYKLAVCTKPKKFIVVRHAKGILVFNMETVETTLMMYESVRKRARNISRE